MTYNLEKSIWTDADFDTMGWHDNNIYRIRLTEDLELDLDYILQWNQPDLEGLPFTFWVAPATLVFKNIKNLRFDFSFAIGLDNSFEIEDIDRHNQHQWTIILQQGDIHFEADGYE